MEGKDCQEADQKQKQLQQQQQQKNKSETTKAIKGNLRYSKSEEAVRKRRRRRI